MADSKASFNVSSSKSGSIISDLRTGISTLRQEVNLLKQDTGGWVNTLSGGVNKLRGGGAGVGSNQVAPEPRFAGGGALAAHDFNPQVYTGGPTGNQVFSNANNGGGGGGGRGSFGEWLSANRGPISTALFTGSISALPKTSEAVDMNLATSRAVFYQQQSSGYGSTGSVKGDYGNVTRMMKEAQRAGTITNKFDAANALATASSYGISGPNFNDVFMGSAQMSNLTPGMGLEQSMKAYGAVQQGRNVNMLRAVGIRIRGEDGSMKPMPQIIDEIWSKLNREKIGGEPLTVEDIKISLQPGNALDMMITNLFGTDSLVRRQVSDGLIQKARTGGKRLAGADLKEQARETGASTSAVQSLSKRVSTASDTLMQLAPSMSSVFEFGNKIVSSITSTLNFIDRFIPILKMLGGIKAFGETVFGGGGLSMLNPLNWFKREAGGPVAKENPTPYIVGERGPELFMPKVDGTIIPNHELKAKNYPFRHEGGEVHNKTHNAPDTRPAGKGKIVLGDKELEDILKQAGFKDQGLENAKKIAQAESGKRPWAFNPHDKDLSYGLFQINMLGGLAKERLAKEWKDANGGTFKLSSNEDLYDALTNAKVARHMSAGGKNWSQWSTKGVLSGGSAGSSGSGASESSDGGSSSSSSSSKDDSKPTTLRGILDGFNKDNKSVLGDFIKGAWENIKGGGQAQHTYNYGGVTIAVNGSSNPSDTVAALKSALSSQTMMNQAAQS